MLWFRTSGLHRRVLGLSPAASVELALSLSLSLSLSRCSLCRCIQQVNFFATWKENCCRVSDPSTCTEVQARWFLCRCWGCVGVRRETSQDPQPPNAVRSPQGISSARASPPRRPSPSRARRRTRPGCSNCLDRARFETQPHGRSAGCLGGLWALVGTEMLSRSWCLRCASWGAASPGISASSSMGSKFLSPP